MDCSSKVLEKAVALILKKGLIKRLNESNELKEIKETNSENKIKQIYCDYETFEYLTLLTSEYLVFLTNELHRISQIQRRSLQPSLGDLSMLFWSLGIDVHDLEYYYKKSSALAYSSITNDMPNDIPNSMPNDIPNNMLNNIPNNMPNNMLNNIPNNMSNDTHSLNNLSSQPPKKSLTSSIPNWMPPLPAPHSYSFTPIYTKRNTDPREIRKRIAAESHFVEEALVRFDSTISDSDIIDNTNFTSIHLIPTNDHSKSITAQDNLHNDLQKISRDGCMDLVALAAKKIKPSLDSIYDNSQFSTSLFLTKPTNLSNSTLLYSFFNNANNALKQQP